MKFYGLRNGGVVETNMIEWGQLLNSNDRIIEQGTVGNVMISTIFLGINHAFDDGPPLLFETMIFGGPLDGSTWRYPTLEEAKTGHAKAVIEVLNTLTLWWRFVAWIQNIFNQWRET